MADRKPLPASKVKATADAAYWALTRMAEKNSSADRMLDQALDAARREEREHRGFGARFTRGAARYRVSIETAARYFVAQRFAEHQLNRCPQYPAERWATMQTSCLYAAALAEVLERLPAELDTAIAAIDYAIDIGDNQTK